jgi:hypothetical protein
MGVKTDAFFAWNWHQNDNCSMLAWEQSSFFNCARKFAEWISSSFLDDMLLIVPFSMSRGEREYYCWCFTTTRFDLNLRVVREMYVRVFSEGDGAVEENISVNYWYSEICSLALKKFVLAEKIFSVQNTRTKQQN